MTFDVWHRTYFSGVVIASGLDYETAQERVRNEAKINAPLFNDHLGQSVTEGTWGLKGEKGFYTKIETMTAEAGWVMDCYSAEPHIEEAAKDL